MPHKVAAFCCEEWTNTTADQYVLSPIGLLSVLSLDRCPREDSLALHLHNTTCAVSARCNLLSRPFHLRIVKGKSCVQWNRPRRRPLSSCRHRCLTHHTHFSIVFSRIKGTSPWIDERERVAGLAGHEDSAVHCICDKCTDERVRCEGGPAHTPGTSILPSACTRRVLAARDSVCAISRGGPCLAHSTSFIAQVHAFHSQPWLCQVRKTCRFLLIPDLIRRPLRCDFAPQPLLDREIRARTSPI